MPQNIPKEQFASKEANELSHDYMLLYIVVGVLGVFYFVIMWILSSSNTDRVQRLNKLKHS